MAIKVKTNTKLDVGYVKFKTGKVAETIEIRPGVLLDLDKSGNAIGVEVLSLNKLAPLLKTSQHSAKSSKKAA